MYDYFDKHGKKFLAVVGSLLVLVFLLPAGFRGNGGGNTRLGTVDGRRVNAADIELAQNTLRSVDRLIYPVRGQDGQPRETPLPLAVFGDGLYRQLEQNPVLLHLLMTEAAQAGAVPEDRTLDQFLASPTKLRADRERDIDLDKVNPTVKDALRDDLRRLFSIREYFVRSGAGIKISRPLVDDQLARGVEQIKARVAVFNAADYEKQAKPPTDDELKRQFDAYAGVAPVATGENPFGFGYLVPDRLAVQWLRVPDAEVAAAVAAAKPDERWEEDAILYYRRNPDDFQATKPPATQPTTRPFEEARADVLKKLREPLIELKKREVAGRIGQQLNALVPAKVTPAASQRAGTQPADPALSFDALQRVADAVQKQTGVRPTAVAPAGLLSRDELAKQPGFGGTTVADRAAGFAAGPAYLFDNQRAFRDDAAKMTTALEIGRPSTLLSGPDGAYVARVVAVSKAHPPASIDAVKPQVEQDVRRAHAFTLAADAAQAALDKANAGGGLAASGLPLQTSDWFGATDTAPTGLTGDSAAALIGPAFETLRGLTSPAGLPVRTIAKLRRDGRAAVIEVFDVKTTLTTKDEQEARYYAQQSIVRDLMPRNLIEQWFDFDAVSRRVGYVPDTAPKSTGPADPRNPSSPNNPANPLLPG